jgi:hypothetical protein
VDGAFEYLDRESVESLSEAVAVREIAMLI